MSDAIRAARRAHLDKLDRAMGLGLKIPKPPADVKPAPKREPLPAQPDEHELVTYKVRGL